MIKPAFISVIRDDEDIVLNMLIYYYNLGIRDYFILLHKASAELRAEVRKAINMMPEACFHITGHDKDEHYHDKDCRILSDMARAEGFQWIVGSDADEILVLKRHSTIQDFLAQFDNHQTIVLLFKWRDFRTDKEVMPNQNPFLIMKYGCNQFMDETSPGWLKSIGKFNEEMCFQAGFHTILNFDVDKIIQINPEIAVYNHYPERNFLQFKKKHEIQQINWLNRYNIKTKIPDFADRLISINGSRIVASNSKNENPNSLEYVLDQVDDRMFKL